MRNNIVAVLLVASTSCAQTPASVAISVPPGFQASVFAQGIGLARHMAFTPDGRTLYVALEDGAHSSVGSSRIPREHPENARGGVIALRDTNGDGRADVQSRLYEDAEGGTGIALRGDTLYFSSERSLLRFRLTPDGLHVAGAPDTIIAGMPDGGHRSRAFALDDQGNVFINVGSESNICTESRSHVPDPCTERDSRAGIWRYDIHKLHQRHPVDGEHWVLGYRNAVGVFWHPQLHALYATTHGRDALHEIYPQYYTQEQGDELPSEELIRANRGDDYGWPYCYYDRAQKKNVLGPEYGGDGRKVGRCASTQLPLIGFPGHWAPDDLTFYLANQFPAKYRGGAFIAFHGSWNRRNMDGYRVVFVPFGANGAPNGSYETFADGFAGPNKSPGGAVQRPSGLAVAPDGSLFVAEDQRGTIWRVSYAGAR